MKYILQPDGSIKNMNNNSDELSRSEVKKIKNKIYNSIYEKTNIDVEINTISDSIDYENLNPFDSTSNFKREFENIINDLDDNFFSKRVKLKKNQSFDFISEDDDKEEIYSYPSFNSPDNVFAKEFEILTGWSGIKGSDEFIDARILSIVAFFSNAAAYIGFIEAIVEANKILQGTNDELQESYTFRYGKYSIDGFDIFSKFVLNILNYPKDKVSIDDRFISFLLGFLSWIKPDRLIDIDYLVQEIAGNANEDVSSLTELVGTALYDSTPVTSVLPVNIIVGLLIYSIEALLVLNGSLEKRIDLLFKKFSQEIIWNNKILYSSKEKERLKLDNNSTENFFSEFNFYYVKFYIERINVGSKFLKNVLQKGTYYSKRDKESSRNRVLGGKFYQTESKSINFSRSDKGFYNWSTLNTKKQNLPGEQPTRLRALPQALMLHKQLIRDLHGNSGKNVISNGNDDRPLINIGKDLIQNFYVPKDEKSYRIPEEIVKKIEEHLESEYMPFYFHDVRTNEILSFHAFLESLSDTFDIQHDTATGFGRMDPVKTLKSTSRKLDISFSICATSKKDHDLMWYQINRLITMVYPQYTRGIPIYEKEGNDLIEKFSVPFSQVPGSNPLVRIRVGDVIKSNYSKTNLSRAHEIKKVVGTNDQEVLDVSEYDDQIKTKGDNLDKVLKEKGKKYPYNTSTSGIPILSEISFIDNQFIERLLLPGLYRSQEELLSFIPVSKGYANIKIATKVRIEDENIAIGKNNNASIEVIVIDEESPYNGKTLIVDARSIVSYEPAAIKDIKDDNKRDLREKYQDIVSGYKDTSSDRTSEEVQNIINNPITLSFESGLSKGLAGFITSFQMENMINNTTTWETGVIGSRAPKSVKITIGFSVIHDIAPGLDYTGMMRAPIYNVGQINNEIFGDPYDTDLGGVNSGTKNARKKSLR